MDYKLNDNQLGKFIDISDNDVSEDQSIKSQTDLNISLKKLPDSPYFIQYNRTIDSDNLFNSDFPLFLMTLFQEYFKNRSNKSNYFSFYFSTDRDKKLEAYLETALYLTSQFLPECFFNPDFFSFLINQSTKSNCKSSKLSILILTNMIEHSFEAVQLLLTMELFPKISHLISSPTSNQEIKLISYFLLSSLAIYDLGDFSIDLYNFFIQHSGDSNDVFRISLRVFSFLSQHHHAIINQQQIIDKLLTLIVPGCSISNENCLKILIHNLHNHPQNIDYVANHGLFEIIHSILDYVLQAKLTEKAIHEMNIREIEINKENTQQKKLHEMKIYKQKLREINQNIHDAKLIKRHRKQVNEMSTHEMKLHEKKLHELQFHENKERDINYIEVSMISLCFDVFEIILRMTRQYDDVIFSNEFIQIYLCFLELENNKHQFRICSFFALAIAVSTNDVLLELFHQGIFGYLYNYCMSICTYNDIQNIFLGSDRFFSIYPENCSDNYSEEKESLFEVLQNIVFDKQNEKVAALAETILHKLFPEDLS